MLDLPRSGLVYRIAGRLARGALALAVGAAAAFAQDDPLAGLPPANEGSFEGGATGTEADAGANNAVPEDALQSSGSFDVPTGGRPSPLFGAQPFTQRMLLFEEFGRDAMPASYTAGPSLPMPVSAESTCDRRASEIQPVDRKSVV